MTLILYIFLPVLAILIIVNIVLTLRAGKQTAGNELHEIKIFIGNMISNLKDTEKNLKDEFVTNRRESAETARDLRGEIGEQLNKFTQTFSEQFGNLTKSNEEKLEVIRKTFEEKLVAFQKSIDSNSKESRTELKENLDVFKRELNDALKDYKERLKEQFTAFERSQQTQNAANSEKISELKSSLETSVKTMQEGNEKKLEEMRKTVDEKLNETLEKRLGESFKQVSDRLEAVHKGLGEMQTLAVSVGDLKKVMSNVKSRGVLGEYQLQNIIEDLLTNEQYEKNVKTKSGSGAVVEFAIKMPHGNNLEKTLWLPIDSKFPKEDYEALVDAYEKGDAEKIDEYRKAFINGIKKNAKDIKEKYIDPPNTTEYGIMFLPYESLFGEVLRVPGLFEQLQKDYKITITGPTTLSALLNSLQMGFRTLAIEKRSSEVWDLLGAVKTEFGQFGDVLAKTKKKLIEATNVIDTSEVRTRAIERRLRNVQELPAGESKIILDTNEDAIDDVAS
ncbi:MAG: DNA recombination protein RmuC [Hydrotalea flava]|uniref:DNA recombination protein RmuC n=1 Tax=Hydrotalea TaxID=1004300 RepID=UPI000944928F|nr:MULTISPECIES: DNA recombination protein RmuC [Hydrotalea]NIM34634.1 DNA recombination protein RmuC [Hydrotalea flava]NIM37476.1 DNA recombination protein RmuC [Hydrotalea flava]NIN02644.1 DNA recombination protein RmuC [Hydrotalea flava]NIN14319.1 DNA recombination protein RmuC [Hydrotalea flava]NIO93402.1 DNA recombination protein RmuC [Hydrotalea flava]